MQYTPRTIILYRPKYHDREIKYDKYIGKQEKKQNEMSNKEI